MIVKRDTSAQVYVMQKDGTTYTFQPEGNWTKIVRFAPAQIVKMKRGRKLVDVTMSSLTSAYWLPVDEARQLWARLKKQGFTKQ